MIKFQSIGYRRICFYGGAGCGKSVIAAEAFVALKKKHFKTELVQEYIKQMAYENRIPESGDQVKIFGEQLWMEDRVLRRNRVQYVVTDSPVFLGTCYAKQHNAFGWKHLTGLSNDFDILFKPLHIFVKRGKKPYQKDGGRFQDEKAAREMDEYILSELEELGQPVHYMTTLNKRKLFKLLDEK